MKVEDKIKLESRFNKASKLLLEKKPSETLKIFNSLNKEFPDNPAILLMLGSINFTSKNMVAALYFFEKAVSIVPRYELASRGLFHCLMDHKRYDEAYNEIQRFTKINGHSKEYELICEELDEQGFFNRYFEPDERPN